MGRLDDRIALVTGAARGLGASIAAAFAREGAVVVCADVADSAEVVATLPGVRHRAMTLDVSDPCAVANGVMAIVEEYGSLDILANNAGVSQPIAPIVDTSDETIDQVLRVNVKGLIHCARAAGRVMIEQRRGRIINTASQAGKCAWPNW